MKRDPVYWFSLLCVLMGAASYGLLSVIIKMAYEDGFTQGQVTVHQTGIGMAMLWLIALARWRRWQNPLRGSWLKLALIGTCGLAMTTILYNAALQRLDASLAIVLLFQFTWITILLDSIQKRTWPGKFRLLAIVIVMIGTVLAAQLPESGLTKVSIIGVLAGFLSAVSYSLFIWWTGQLEGQQDAVIRSAVMVSAGFVLITLLYGSEAFSASREAALVGWGLLLGTLAQVVPTLLFNIGIPRIGSSLSALLGAVELPVVILTAWTILGEPLSVWRVIGILLIVAGIGIAELPTGKRKGNSARLEEKH
ncbi:DMT family transporter [Paenibacillus sp. BC26]|uniref:EamA family transporter n=1 Tax=Paenibacillus sp. BC26 TaxID=1881032 RepID=UPI0008EE0349|nr:DMT family transporter [Paenibacillus sp. BC26]SFT12682.1 Threonine/homoserine efflux transporter RhtA [Paenibacillus sp. BC26]